MIEPNFTRESLKSLLIYEFAWHSLEYTYVKVVQYCIKLNQFISIPMYVFFNESITLELYDIYYPPLSVIILVKTKSPSFLTPNLRWLMRDGVTGLNANQQYLCPPTILNSIKIIKPKRDLRSLWRSFCCTRMLWVCYIMK